MDKRIEPWHVVEHPVDCDGRRSKTWTIQTQTPTGAAGECIAQKYGESPIENARLMAAAPELLEALEEILNNWFVGLPKGSPLEIAARAAIDKAEGRS